MVSTRQMSTAISSSHGLSNSNNNVSDDVNNASSSSQAPNTRMSVITRQSSALTSVVAVAGTSSASSSRSAASSPTTSRSVNNNNHNNINNDQQQHTQRIFLLDLPVEILDKIFSYVGYKKVGQMRVISKQMNQVCSGILNSTFSKLQTQMLHRFQNVKAMMPRRESARRNHPLACECDIIETCYMRLCLLQMTFGKHIERKHCCFFPGGILDEVYYVLNYIRTTPKLERPYKVTDELFDLSTMAMEYFKEHIEPNLPEIVYFNKNFFNITSKSKQSYSIAATAELTDSGSSSMSSPPQSNMVLRKGIRKIKQGMKMYNNQLTALRSELRTCKRKSSEQGKQIAEQQKLLADQQKQTLEYANRLDENDRKNEEMSRKFSTLLQELNKCKTELQYWRSKSPAVQVCTSCGHKMTPVVAPEEYQALVNQGVKPQDINLDDVDDSDTSSNIYSDLGLDNQSASEFVFPDEATTAKLLAASSATAATVTTSTILPITTTTTTAITSSKRRHDGTIKSTSITTAATATTATNNPAILKMSIFGNDNITTMFMNNTTVIQQDAAMNNNLGKYNGNNNKPPNSAAGSSGGNFNNATTATISSLLSSSGNNNDIVSNLASPISPSLNNNSLSSDTKKARKVQNKGSRCHNTNSKRNK